jgi:GDP-4-dehydro-6-deoxy-D-mannose reductase
MKVLVTGATGFVGQHLLRELAARGLAATGTGYAEGTAGRGEPRSVDFRHAGATRELVARVRPQAVVHLAAQSSVGASFDARRETFEVNVLGTMNLLAAVRDEAPGARVLVITSADLYGPSTPGAPHRETSPLCPVSPYGSSKAAQDLVAALAAAAYSLALIRVRPFPQAGPGQRPTFALPAFAAQIAAFERAAPESEGSVDHGGERVLQVGNLDVIRDYTDVRDGVRAYADLLTQGEPGEAYNVCSGRGLKLRQLVETLAAKASVPIRIEVDRMRLRPADLQHLVGDPAKLKQATGWEPRIQIEETLADLLEEARSRPAKARVGSSTG